MTTLSRFVGAEFGVVVGEDVGDAIVADAIVMGCYGGGNINGMR